MFTRLTTDWKRDRALNRSADTLRQRHSRYRMSFDNLCKLLAEKHPQRFATWILGKELDTIEVLKTELSIEPIRADSVTFLQATGRILHLEFQTQWQSNPPMPLRLLDYWVRLHRLYRSPVTQVVVLLLPPSEEAPIETAFELESTRHEYQVVKMWEQDPERFLNDPALLPLATLTQTQNPSQLLNQVAQQVAEIDEADDRQEISAYVQLMAGLKYDKNEVRRIFREGIMRESVIYQEIWQEGEQVGEQRGEQIGEQRGRSEVARNLLLEGMDVEAIARVTGLSIEQIQQLQTTQHS